MNKEIIHDGQGRIVGQLLDQGSVIILLSATGAMLGRYVKSQDYTYDDRGAKIGSGNQLLRLVRG